MTTKTYNALRSSLFQAAIQDPEISEALRHTDRVRVYEAIERPGNASRRYVCAYETQMNDETIRQSGLVPERTNAKTDSHTWKKFSVVNTA